MLVCRRVAYMGFGISRCAKRILDPYQVTHYKAFRISNCYGSFLTNQYIWERNRGFFGGSHGQMCTNGIQHNHEITQEEGPENWEFPNRISSSTYVFAFLGEIFADSTLVNHHQKPTIWAICFVCFATHLKQHLSPRGVHFLASEVYGWRLLDFLPPRILWSQSPS